MIGGQSANMITEPTAQDFKSNNIFNQIEAVLAEDGPALVGRVKGRVEHSHWSGGSRLSSHWSRAL